MEDFRKMMMAAVGVMTDPGLIYQRLAFTVDSWKVAGDLTQKERYWIEIDVLIDRLKEVMEK